MSCNSCDRDQCKSDEHDTKMDSYHGEFMLALFTVLQLWLTLLCSRFEHPSRRRLLRHAGLQLNSLSGTAGRFPRTRNIKQYTSYALDKHPVGRYHH